MKLLVLFGLLAAIGASIAIPPHQKDVVLVTIKTELGSIVVELYPKKAPRTVENFLRYLKGGYYTQGVFHRTVKMDNQPDKKVKIEVIQAGANPAPPGKGFPPIPLERTNATGVRHVNGAISMARDGADSATSDFFICIGNQPELDYGGKRNPDGQGFAAFGKVTKGMDVVKAIQMRPAKEQSLNPPIRILSVEISK